MSESPLNGTVHGIALAQLAIYQEFAREWPRYPDNRAIRCGKCDQSIWFLYDENCEVYRYTDEEKLALVVAHIRQNHEEYVNGTN